MAGSNPYIKTAQIELPKKKFKITYFMPGDKTGQKVEKTVESIPKISLRAILA